MVNALKSLKRIKKMAFLITLQLAIGLSLLNSTGIIIEENGKKIQSFDKLFNYEKTYMVDMNKSLQGGNSDMGGDEVKNIIEKQLRTLDGVNLELKDLKSKGIIKNNNIYFGAMTPRIKGLDDVETKYKELGDSQISNYMARINVNYDFINRYNLNISKGRSFNESDFNIDYKNQSIPIIIGNEYSKSVNIGDKFTGVVNTGVLDGENNIEENDQIKETKNKDFVMADVSYEVIGFYAHNAIPALMTNKGIIGNLIYSDGFIIVPTVKGLAYINELSCIGDGGLFIEVNNSNYIEYIEKKINELLVDSGIKMRTVALKDEFLEYKKSLLKNVINSFLLGGTLIFLSIIGITSVILGELNRRKNEFGIRIALGANIRTLCKEIALEISLLVTFSGILSLLSLYIKGILLGRDNFISITIVLINVIVVCILTICISIFPISKIKKMNPIELLRRK